MFDCFFVQSHKLPPTKQALVQHIRRANYQAAVWKAALTASPEIPGPDGQGWKVTDGHLTVDWTSEAPAPKSVLALVACGCRTDCSTRRCQCRVQGLVCTDACRCQTCQNCLDDDTDDDNDDLED